MRKLWIWPLCCILLLTAGCGTVQSDSTNTMPANHTVSSDGLNQSASRSANERSVDPHLYQVCETIYHGVSKTIAENRNVSYDTQLETITDLGTRSAPNSPNGILFEQAEAVVTIEDAINGEGAPASAYSKLQTALDALKNSLQKYRPTA
ncbi:hypothetical protein Heshes_15600 [Alicyclobacillus hesperidum]|uniref:Sporulation lipoprotein YhcN/YlaJ (Spore_YhcN_YlaJ) n=1 Tax=Alicyclobacillus hesperidum TaxID=89784 RepID=A0A1H2TEM7_9BACL|nr:hypothetical protein [Alicyclobacillus hesperidum]GLV13876.1 hypothetical protein Heshes_15600 [Alicyclobacillus hesperidum]SDW42371.1 hypothetical protein SAMN04489725_105201 [Alicyclobacillus hesperidum]